MHILIGLAMAIALLYFWLLGHWFARLLMFLALVVLLGFFGSIMTNLLGGLVGIAIAWPLAGCPAYYWRHQVTKAAAAG